MDELIEKNRQANKEIIKRVRASAYVEKIKKENKKFNETRTAEARTRCLNEFLKELANKERNKED